jgi:hypothetical protein
MAGITIEGLFIYDDGNEKVLEVVTTASAVNWLSVAGSIAGAGPALVPKGADADIDLNLAGKGAGKINLTSPVKVTDAKDIEVGTGTGTKIGTAAGQKLALWNAAPIVQPAHADQAAVVLGNANAEIGGLTISAAYDQAEVEALRDRCEELADDVRNLSVLLHAIRTALVNFGAIKGSA